MNKILFSSLILLSSCSGGVKAGYIFEGVWEYHRADESTDVELLTCVEVQNDGTYTIDKSGCVA